MPAIGYDQPDQSHFTSRHYWEVGAIDAAARTGWLGRYLDRVGARDNPLQGLSLDCALRRRSRPRSAGRLDRRPRRLRLLDAPDVWGDVEDRMLDAIGALGALPTTATPALAQAPARAPGGDRCAAAAARPSKTASTLHEPGRLPEGRRRVSRAGWPARRDARRRACRSLRRARRRRATTTRTTTRRRRSPTACKLTADSLLAFQRDLEARGLADRVLVHVWSEFGRRAEENGSTGTDHGAAGAGFLIGSRVNGHDGRRVPRARERSTSDGNLRATVRLPRRLRALLEQWLGTDAAGDHPGRARFARPKAIR